MKSEVKVSKIHRIEGKNGTMAICNLNLNGEFTINGVTLNKSSKDGSLFLGFPSKVVRRKDSESKAESKEYVDVSHPITAGARQEVTDLVIEEWNEKFESKEGG